MPSSPAPDRLLISAARTFFAREGYDGVSLREVSRAAGLSYGSVVYHFGSKRGLYEAVVASSARPLEAGVREAAEREEGGDEGLLAAARSLAENVRRHPDVPALLLQEVAVGRSPSPPAVCALGGLLEMLTELARDAPSVGRGSKAEEVARGILYRVLGGSLVERALEPAAPPADAGSSVRLTGIEDLLQGALEEAAGEG